MLYIIILSACSDTGIKYTLDLTEGWRFSADEQRCGLSEKWYAFDYDDNGWAQISAGRRWEDQGFADLDGWAWYRKTIVIPAEWGGKPVWLIFGGVNDAYTLFINGIPVSAFGDEASRTVAEKMTMAEIAQYLRFGKENLIALQVNDWGNSGGLWRLPVLLTTDLNAAGPVSLLSCLPVYEKNELLINNNFSSLGNRNGGTHLSVSITKKGQAVPIVVHEVNLDSSRQTFTIQLPFPGTNKRGIFHLSEKVTGAQGHASLSLSRRINWNPPPYPPDDYGGRKLNNFVTELLNTQLKRAQSKRLVFYQPSEGWIYISLNSLSGDDGLPEVTLDNARDPLVLRVNPDNGVSEAMHYVTAGEHTLAVDEIYDSQLIVRRIPEIIFSDHPSSPHITPFGPYDWPYLTKYVLPHVNTIVTSGSTLPAGELEQWRTEGRHWIVHAGLPGLGRTRPPDVKDVVDTWAKSPGTTDPRFNGLIIDEFVMASTEHYRIWTEALSKLYDRPDFFSKTFYAYCTDIFYAPGAPAIPFGKKLLELGGRFAIERYLPEKSTESEAYALLFEQLSHTYQRMNKSLDGIGEQLVITLGYLTDPTETLSIYPSVDYRVYMDMQFHLLATDPTFHDLYGIQEYLSNYADEELLRWAHQLFRHYCIEGRRTRLTSDPYELSHLQNPDFAEGLEGWHTEEAEKGNIQIMTTPGYSWLQGRYPRTSYGDQFVCMRRSVKEANRISQLVKNLDPSRLYSLKLIAADRRHLGIKQELALSIDLKGAEIIDDQTFRFVYPSNYGHTLDPYDRDHPAWFNFYRIVFRPKSESTLLTISDWQNPVKQGGPAGQEISCNFIEIQPFLEK